MWVSWLSKVTVAWRQSCTCPVGQGRLNAVLKLLVFGDAEDEDPQAAAEEGKAPTIGTTPSSPTSAPEQTTLQYTVKLLICVMGLQGSYLTWGVLQV